MNDDGTAFISQAQIDALTYEQLKDYRHDLIRAILNPGTEYDVTDPEFSKIDRQYRMQLGKVETRLKTFPYDFGPRTHTDLAVYED